jgi:hypothetical protein
MKTVSRADITDLQQIPNFGPAIAKDMRLNCVSSPHDLRDNDPYAMYDELCRITGTRHDLCLFDVFIAAVRFMAGKPAKPWWKCRRWRDCHSAPGHPHFG